MRIFLAIISLLLAGCNVFDVHPYDCNIKGERDINRKNAARIEQALAGKTEFSFAFISDTQRWYDQTQAAVSDINARCVDFVLHGGDLTDFGITILPNSSNFLIAPISFIIITIIYY